MTRRENIAEKDFAKEQKKTYLFLVKPIEPPDSHFLNATIGWLELGDSAEAMVEWDRISEANRHRPDVLDARWRIEAARKDWKEALYTAQELLKHAPQSPIGWINQSYTLHELKRTQEAWDQLLPISEQFPKISVIAYNLACYACQLGRMEEAQKFLDRAMTIKGKSEIKEMALHDPDLVPMREIIQGL